MFFIFIIGCSYTLLDDWCRSQANNVLLMQRQFSWLLWIAIVSELKLASMLFCNFMFFSAVAATYLSNFTDFERGRLFAKREVQSIEVGPGGFFFTGDGTGLLMVGKWLEEPKVAPSWELSTYLHQLQSWCQWCYASASYMQQIIVMLIFP